jgi:hypothetical protein
MQLPNPIWAALPPYCHPNLGFLPCVGGGARRRTLMVEPSTWPSQAIVPLLAATPSTRCHHAKSMGLLPR